MMKEKYICLGCSVSRRALCNQKGLYKSCGHYNISWAPLLNNPKLKTMIHDLADHKRITLKKAQRLVAETIYPSIKIKKK